MKASDSRGTTGGEEGRPTIAVIGGKAKLVKKAHELGLRVVYIQYPRTYREEHWPYVDQALLVDYTDTQRLLPLAKALHQAYPFQKAVSLFELGLLPAAEVAEALGLGGTPRVTVEMLLDKWQMRQHLNALGLRRSPPRWAGRRTTCGHSSASTGSPWW